MSDAMSDIARSEDNTRAGYEFIQSEKAFLAKPTTETLKSLYDACDGLSMCRSGYWGDDPSDLGEKAKKYFTDRFSKSKKLKIIPDDVAFFLNGIKPNLRVKELSDLLTQTQKSKSKKPSSGVGQHLYDHITIAQRDAIMGDITGPKLGEIMKASGVGDKYSLPYQD